MANNPTLLSHSDICVFLNSNKHKKSLDLQSFKLEWSIYYII
jgi:hypothetical protein